MRASALVLNYNGLPWLETCFSSLDAATDGGRRHDVYLVDNGSNDGSQRYIAETFPWVRIWQSDQNAYGFSYNRIAAKLDTDSIILLNNDVEVDRDFIEPLIENLAAPDVFAVVARILAGDRITGQGSRADGGFSRGLWWFRQLPDLNQLTTTFFVPNQAAYSRAKYCELGGFDSNLWPMYHEDIDLSYRAWRRGWRILYEPRSVIYHFGGQTRKARGYDWHRQVETQNMFLMLWKNFDDRYWLAEHAAWLTPRLARAAATGDISFLRGFCAALRRRKAMMEQRRVDAALRRVPDRDVFQRIHAGINGDLQAAIA